MSEGYEKSRKKIKKPLDKLPKVWYNKDVKREEREKSKVCAEKKFFGNAEKRLDKLRTL